MNNLPKLFLRAITFNWKVRQSLTASAMVIPTSALFGGLNAWPDDTEDRQA